MTTSDIELGELDFAENYFDYILFADVLEHLYNPGMVLGKMKKYLKSSGSIIASVPNVMHYSVVKNLLNGNWTYEDAGILDRTHLRFFTLNEINKMFMSEGYNITHIQSNETFRSEEDSVFLEKINGLTDGNLEKQYLAYQYLVQAEIS